MSTMGAQCTALPAETSLTGAPSDLMVPMTQHDLGNRIRAARHLAGLQNVRDLAKAIQQQKPRGLGETRLRQIERAEIQATIGDIREISDACEIPWEWFVVDFSRLAEIAPPNPREMLARLTAEAVERARKKPPKDPPGTQPQPEANQES